MKTNLKSYTIYGSHFIKLVLYLHFIITLSIFSTFSKSDLIYFECFIPRIYKIPSLLLEE